MDYNDSQSVHNHKIQESVRKSIVNLLKDKVLLTEDEVLGQIIADPILKAKEDIIEYCRDKTEHSSLKVTFSDLLLYVWQRIIIHKDKDEIKRILNQELNDSICKCFTGRLSRLVNCLNGFYEDITINIGDKEQIGNIITMVKEQLGSDYTVEKHKSMVEKELVERNYDRDVIDEWIAYIE